MLYVTCINQTERKKKIGYKLVLSIYECIVLKNNKMTKRKERKANSKVTCYKKRASTSLTPQICVEHRSPPSLTHPHP